MATLWPFEPTSIGENLKYYTDVRKARSGEFRDSLHNAVQTLAFVHSEWRDPQRTAIEQTFKNNITGEWDVPVWFFATRGVSLAYADTSIDVDDADYRASGKALIYQDEDNYELVNIDTYASGAIVLPSGEFVSQDYANAWVMPVLECLCPQGMNRSISVNITDFVLQFIVKIGTDLAAANYDTQDGKDIITDSPSVSSPLEGGISQALDFIQNDFGAIEIITDETYTRWRGTVEYTDVTNAARWARRQHLDRIRGKDRPFFLPTFQNDLKLAQSNAFNASNFYISQGYYESIAALVGRYILVEGSPNNVVKVTGTNSPNRLLLDEQPGTAKAAGAVLSFCHLVRYDTDAFEIEHLRTSDGWRSVYSALVVEVVE